MCHYSQADPSASSRHISQFWTFCCVHMHVHAYKWVWMHVQSCDFVVTWVQCSCCCVCLGVCARLAILCAQACTVVSESKDKHRLSARLPAARVIDVDGNAQTAAEELLTHERQTRWLPLSFDGQISNGTHVQLTPTDAFISSSFNFCISLKTWLRISYFISTIYCRHIVNWVIIVTFSYPFGFVFYLFELWNCIFFSSAS